MRYFITKILLSFIAISVAFIFTSHVSAQERTEKAVKIQEYIPDPDHYEDALARLDDFAVQLQTEQKGRGYIIGYNKPDYPVGIYSRQLNNGKYILTKLRGIAESRLTVIDGGYRENAAIELWLVPDGAEPPTPNATSNYKIDEHRHRLFDKPLVSNEGGFLILDDDTLASCASELKKYPNAKARLSAFSSSTTERAKIIKLAKKARQILTTKYLIDARRIIITTGKKEYAEIEFWILP